MDDRTRREALADLGRRITVLEADIADLRAADDTEQTPSGTPGMCQVTGAAGPVAPVPTARRVLR